jgi:RNA polymerase-binding transcription factor DksA
MGLYKIKLAADRGQPPIGASLTHCEEGEIAIPRARREAIPGIRLCIGCQTEIDKQQSDLNRHNRRAGKDNQLR